MRARKCSVFICKQVSDDTTLLHYIGLLKKECLMAIFYFARCVRKLRYYSDVIHSFDLKSTIEHDGGCLKCMIVYLARDIPAFVMYCVYGASRSSLLIESTDSMIYTYGNC